MLANAAQVYQAFDMNIQPKWFTLLALLDSKGSVSIVEASQLLGLSQPALSQFCKQLSEEGLVDVTVDPEDSRRKELSLSTKGNAAILRMRPIWEAVEAAAIELCEDNANDFYRSLIRFESAFDSLDLFERTKKILDSQAIDKQAADKQMINHTISILDFSAELAHYFESINTQWIEQMFVLEDIDKQVLQDPQRHIIDKGGRIWFAKHPTLGVVGACALLNKGNGNVELTKMGVLDSVRGMKVGERLLQHVIQEALNMRVETLFLLTNAKCEAAIHLYEKNGFAHDADIMQRFGQSYQRCNVAMRYVKQ
ncbi:GNAT family N-acetyltransferase [Glaciecola sp. MH2013]|nr:GNAT family N-acetyltransferase [Glaciecola sp. MH2013]